MPLEKLLGFFPGFHNHFCILQRSQREGIPNIPSEMAVRWDHAWLMECGAPPLRTQTASLYHLTKQLYLEPISFLKRYSLARSCFLLSYSFGVSK